MNKWVAVILVVVCYVFSFGLFVLLCGQTGYQNFEKGGKIEKVLYYEFQEKDLIDRVGWTIYVPAMYIAVLFMDGGFVLIDETLRIPKKMFDKDLWR